MKGGGNPKNNKMHHESLQKYMHDNIKGTAIQRIHYGIKVQVPGGMIFIWMLGAAVTYKSVSSTLRSRAESCEWQGIERAVQIRNRHHGTLFQNKLWRFCWALFLELSQNNNTVANEWRSVAISLPFIDQLAMAAQDGKLALKKVSRLLGWHTALREHSQVKYNTQEPQEPKAK